MISLQVYSLLSGKKGFPAVYHFGKYLDYQVLVLELLGRDLEMLYEKCGRIFSLKSVIFLTLQLLKRFEVIHHAGIIYRDVKPENFLLGAKTNTVYVIDYGLSKQYVNDKGKHVAPGATNELIGTSRYMSVNAHKCAEQSRRDDLEALGYVFAYFLRGKLPWSGLKAASFSEHNKMICDMKRTTGEEELLEGHPVEFAHYIKYVRALEFEAEPNYGKLRNMFKRLYHTNKFKDDGLYDWNKG